MTTPTSIRFDDPTLARLDARAEADGVSRQQLVISLVTQALDAPPVPAGLEVLLLSTSQIASLDQTAARMGLTRIEAIQRFIKQRIEREFIEERQRQMRPEKLKAV